MSLVNICSVIAIIIAFAGILLSRYTARLQREHNILSLRPIGYIILLNYEDVIGVKIVNFGVGPMIILDLKVEDKQKRTTNTLIEYISKKMHGETWSDFVEEVVKRPLAQDHEIVLFAFRDNGNYSRIDFIRIRDELRCLLKDLKITVTYEDLYHNEDVFSRDLGDLFK